MRSLLAGPQDPRGSFASLGGAALVDNLKPAQATVTQLTFPSLKLKVWAAPAARLSAGH